MAYKNHLKLGSTKVMFKGKEVPSTLTSKRFENGIEDLKNLPYSVGTIPYGYAHRADLIADLFYGSPTLDWVVLWTNNISDPFQELNVGDRIKIVELI